MNEKPLERLNYFNGQRLQAADFKVEQDYHMRVRRWLNRSLYTAGIASGLEVRKVPGAPKVRVSPGLALDTLGREIILLDEREEIVFGAQDENNRPLSLYLTIRYGEDVLARQDAACIAAGGAHEKVAWGGPSRVIAEPMLEWSAQLPHESSGKVLLAYVGLGKGCKEVNLLDTGVRRYIGASSAAKVRQYALEGERDVAAIPTTDLANPLRVNAKVSFHIRGRQPSSVTMYLKAREFSPLHYTELGRHDHSLSVLGETEESNPPLFADQTSHAHGFGTLKAVSDTTADHSHSLNARRGYLGRNPQLGRAGFTLQEDGFPPLWSVPTATPDILADVSGTIGGGAHGHNMSGSTDPFAPDLRHKHNISGSGTSGAAGTVDPQRANIAARTGKPLGFVYDLRISIDGADMTTPIRDLIVRSVPPNESSEWNVIGNGTRAHPFADDTKPALPIRLDYLPNFVLSEGEHSIEFSVGLGPNNEANGGRIHYNLYVE